MALLEHHAARNCQGVWKRQDERISLLDGDENRIDIISVLVLVELGGIIILGIIDGSQ